jgi:hypothetical protein
MKKLLFALCVTSALALAANAQEGTEKKAEGKRPEPTPEQKALRKEMIAKYDTNKDGKLDKEERAKMTEEDKAKMKAAAPAKPKKAE